MNRTEATGAWIACGVMACAVAVLAWHLSARGANAGPREVQSVALQAACSVLGLGVAVRAFRRGQSAVRWFVFAACALFAVGMAGFAVWMTTLDYPNATPEDRATMQQDDRDQLPLRVATGVGPLVVASALLLPPVGHYLAYRRRVTTPA